MKTMITVLFLALGLTGFAQAEEGDLKRKKLKEYCKKNI